MLAQRDDGIGQSAGSDNCRLHTDLFFNALDHAVEHGSASVEDAALHAVIGVGAYEAPGRIEADPGEL